MLPEPDDANPKGFQSFLTPHVVLERRLVVMTAAVEFDRQTQFVAVEVHDVGVYWNLPMELALQPSALQFPPK